MTSGFISSSTFRLKWEILERHIRHRALLHPVLTLPWRKNSRAWVVGGTGTDFEVIRTAYAAVVLLANERRHDGIMSKYVRAASRVLQAQIRVLQSMKSIACLGRTSATMYKDSSIMHTRDLVHPAPDHRLFATLTWIGEGLHSQRSRCRSTRSKLAGTEKVPSRQQAALMTGTILLCPWKVCIALHPTLPLALATSRV